MLLLECLGGGDCASDESDSLSSRLFPDVFVVGSLDIDASDAKSSQEKYIPFLDFCELMEPRVCVLFVSEADRAETQLSHLNSWTKIWSLQTTVDFYGSQ